jgi:hypothetical protein
MRERLTTLACALGALFVFATLFLRGGALSAPISQPTTAERADNGLLGAARWLEAEGVRTLSLRERFGALQRRRGLATRGNLLIVSLPAATHFRSDELVALDRWIRDGNTLLVLAALRDRPAWAQFPFVMQNDLQLLTGLNLALDVERARDGKAGPPQDAAPRAARTAPAHRSAEARRRDQQLARVTTQLTAPERSTLAPNRAHPYFAGVARAVAFSDYAPLSASVALPRDGFALSLAHDGSTGEDAFWVRTDGAGTIIVSGFGSLFANRALGLADNAQLLANVIGASVASDGTVVFDDEHQGLSEAYDPAKFYRDSRLYATLAVIALVWLTWVLGGTQLHAPLRRAPAPREVELVRTTGLFLARVLRPAAAARRMFEQFLQRMGGAVGRNGAHEARLWEWLENHPRLTRADVQQLRAWHALAAADRRVPLIRLHNLIVRTERQLAQ